jgi:hypothetical protein
MTAQHAPGPWFARTWTRHSPTTIVREVDGGISQIADVDGEGFDPETLANALLIAAAPDLLALARQYASECAECGGTGSVQQGTDPTGAPAMYACDACFDIRAVIAKAVA